MGDRYFRARVELPGLVPPENARGKLVPGMQAEVLIQVGERSPLGYLLQPIRENRGLRQD